MRARYTAGISDTGSVPCREEICLRLTEHKMATPVMNPVVLW